MSAPKVHAHCPQCGKRLGVSTQDVRARARCPFCRAEFPVADAIPDEFAVDAEIVRDKGGTLSGLGGRPPRPADTDARWKRVDFTDQQAPPVAEVQPAFAAQMPVPSPLPGHPVAMEQQVEQPRVDATPQVPPGTGESATSPADPDAPQATERTVSAAYAVAQRAGDAARLGGSAAVTGARWTVTAIAAVLRGCLWVDAKLYGYRRHALGVVGGLYVIAAVVAEFAEVEEPELIGVIVFSMLLLPLAGARLAFFANDDDQVTFGSMLRGLWASITFAWDGAVDLARIDAAARRKRLGVYMVWSGSVLAGLRGVFLHVVDRGDFESFANGTGATAVLLVFIGLLTYFSKSGEEVDPELEWEGGSGFAAVSALPGMLNFVEGDQKNALAVVQKTEPNLSALLEAIAAWSPKPRSQKADEATYERSFVRHIKSKFPHVEVATQRPVKGGFERNRRIDVVIADTFAVELKKRLRRASEMDRAKSQVQDYAGAWTKGPMLLVVCEAHPKLDVELGAWVDGMRRLELPVVAVAAGTRRGYS